MNKWQKTLTFLGRIFISLFFILSAIHKSFQWQETEHSLTNVLLNWQSFSSFWMPLQNFFTTLLEWVPALLIFLLSIQLLGGLLIFFGLKVRWGAFLLILFLISTTLLFHHFWFLNGSQRDDELILFLKNLAIIGGLLYVLSFGSKGCGKPKSFSSSDPHSTGGSLSNSGSKLSP